MSLMKRDPRHCLSAICACYNKPVSRVVLMDGEKVCNAHFLAHAVLRDEICLHLKVNLENDVSLNQTRRK